MPLLIYVARRFSYLLIALFGVSLITFVVTRVLPGDPASLIVGNQADASTLEAVTERLGLNESIPEQYFKYLGQLFTGDLGDNWLNGTPVTSDLASRWPATVELATFAFLLAVVWAVGLGIVSALKRRSFSDRLADALSGVGVSFPEFWLGLVLIFVFFQTWQIAPAPLGRTMGSPPDRVTGFYTLDAIIAGDWATFRSSAGQLILPVLTLAIVIGAPLLRITRGFMREVMDSGYIRFARALGVKRRSIVMRHALPNVLLPVSTMGAMMYGYLLGGTVLVETVFSWPGIGKYAVDAIAQSNYPPVLAVVLLSALSYLVIYMVMDVLHFVIDPRTRTRS